MGSKISKQRMHKGYQKVWGHFISSNIRSPSIVEKSFQGTSHSPHIRDNFSSNCVSEKENINLTKVRDIFVHHWPKKKQLFQFLHRFHDLGEILKTSFASGGLMHLWSDLGKIIFSPRWNDRMTCLMNQMITRHKYISNELSWAQLGVEEDLQMLTATSLWILATSFYTFWPVLGDWTFDRENKI